jgi:GT2 family glycosyltransferase
MSRVPGYESEIRNNDLTAAAGPILAVDRRKFLEIGGYDPIFFPGRIEDLDLGFRGWMAGYRGYYIPESVAYHRGFGTFAPTFGQAGCDRLALRNSVIFAWKNLSGPRLLDHLAWIPARIVYGMARGRCDFVVACFEALRRLKQIRSTRRALAVGQGNWSKRQESFFRQFQW